MHFSSYSSEETPNPRLGRFVTVSSAGEVVHAFVPPPLPPDPPIDLLRLLTRNNAAERAPINILPSFARST